MGGASTSFIPDYSGRHPDYAGRICCSGFNSGDAYYGAFYSTFHALPSDVRAHIGSRLAKW